MKKMNSKGNEYQIKMFDETEQFDQKQNSNHKMDKNIFKVAIT